MEWNTGKDLVNALIAHLRNAETVTHLAVEYPTGGAGLAVELRPAGIKTARGVARSRVREAVEVGSMSEATSEGTTQTKSAASAAADICLAIDMLTLEVGRLADLLESIDMRQQQQEIDRELAELATLRRTLGG